MTVVASGLGNPRGLTFGEHGVLYVALAGSGAGDGSLIKIRHAGSKTPGAPITVVSGLPSGNDPHGAPPGVGTEGPVSVSVHDDSVFVQVGLFPPPVVPSVASPGVMFGDLLHIHHGTATPVVNVGAFDFAWATTNKSLNPQFPDANPNAVLAVRGGEYVVDAGANTLDWVDIHGHVTVLTYFDVPSESPSDAVPTCIARGRDGVLYVGELLGGSYAPGGARVWRITGGHGSKFKAAVWATGLSTIQGCAVGRDGALYVTEFESHGFGLGPTANPMGDIVRVTSSSITPLNVPGLFWPSGLAVGRDGALYTSNCSISPAAGFGPCTSGGQIVRITM